jgi:hypothetical protein
MPRLLASKSTSSCSTATGSGWPSKASIEFTEGSLSHVGVYADESEFERMHARADAADCKIVAYDPSRSLVTDDPFGVRCELTRFASTTLRVSLRVTAPGFC